MTITMKQTQALTFNHQKLIDRLRLEKKMLTANIKEDGRKLGVKSAIALSYQEFQRIERLSQTHVRIDAGAFADMWQWLAARQPELHLQFEDGELREIAILKDNNKATFIEGWMEGVLTVWQKIKNEINNEEA